MKIFDDFTVWKKYGLSAKLIEEYYSPEWPNDVLYIASDGTDIDGFDSHDKKQKLWCSIFLQ